MTRSPLPRAASSRAKPLIGVVADVMDNKHVAHGVHQKYIDAVAGGAGGFALILPGWIERPGSSWSGPEDMAVALDLLDGLMLSGAASNVGAGNYGQVTADPSLPGDPARDHVTLALARAAIGRGLPVLGICRGVQEINVALGGSLHQAVQDVPSMMDHREPHSEDLDVLYAPAHGVRFAPDSVLGRITGLAGCQVNSLHGQGIDRLAPGLVAEAWAPDGLIEGVRGVGPGFLIGVQWHPEWAFRDNPVSLAIFQAFGDAARAHAGARIMDEVA